MEIPVALAAAGPDGALSSVCNCSFGSRPAWHDASADSSYGVRALGTWVSMSLPACRPTTSRPTREGDSRIASQRPTGIYSRVELGVPTYGQVDAR